MRAYFIKLSLIKSILLTGVYSFAGVSTVESNIQQMQIKSCDKANVKCLTLNSEKSFGSQFQQLYYLKNPIVEFTDNKNHKRSIYKQKSGYLDVANNILVLIEKMKNGSVIETAFNLSNMEVTKNVYKKN